VGRGLGSLECGGCCNKLQAFAMGGGNSGGLDGAGEPPAVKKDCACCGFGARSGWW